MLKTFDEIEKVILGREKRKTIVLAGSHDDAALASLVEAYHKGLVNGCLIGKTEETKALLLKMGVNPEEFSIIQEENGAAAAKLACKMVKEGKADIPMKGKLTTAEFMQAILDKEFGFVLPGGILSQVTVLEYEQENRFLLLGDCAVNILPDYEAKKKILNNTVRLAHVLGIELPRVAVIAPLELVNPKIQATVDAALLSKANERGQINGCIVDGPLGMDNAVNREAAMSKGVSGQVAGRADVLIMPDLCTGNVLTKTLHYFTDLKQAGCLVGASVPVVMTSRTEAPVNKYNSILAALL